MYYNNNVKGEMEYEWFESKRQEVLSSRGIDIVIAGPKVFADPNVVIEPDNRQDYGEERFLAYGMVEGERLCLCFTLRGEKVHLITIFKMHKKQWGKHYGKAENHDGTSDTEKV
jgi:uncharacterized protein